MDYKTYIARKLNIGSLSEAEVAAMLEIPPDNAMGDYARVSSWRKR